MRQGERSGHSDEAGTAAAVGAAARGAASGRPEVRIGVDIGGTFTDLVLGIAGGAGAPARLTAIKVASTPVDPEAAVVAGVRRLLEEAGVAPGAVTAVVHGTTVGSNALLQKTGARAGLITTRGFRDVLEIGRVRTPSMFDLGWDKPEPLIPRGLRLEVAERTAADGTVLVSLDPAEAAAAGRTLVAAGVEAIAVAFLNSYRNPANEIAAAAALRAALPGVAVTASVEVLPEIREYERTSTTAVNAYVLPVLGPYLTRLEAGLKAIGVAAPLFIVNSNGGLSTAATAREKPVFFVSSGRSAGAVGAAALGAAAGEANLVAFDMGGTTASAVLVHEGRLSRTNEYEFRAGISTPSRFIKAGGYMMRVPTVDVAEVGNGAGSIAAIDGGGLMVVGPVSAGAVPGPACYGAGGTRPTVTDANVVLGLLPPTLAGGALALDVEAARAAIARDLAAPLGIGVEAAALGVRAVANANMARAIRAVTVERGTDPRDFALFAFGGSGPAHACDLARSLGIRRVIFPPAPGVFTATGMLAGAIEHHGLATFPAPLETLDLAAVRAAVARLEAEALAALAREGQDAAAVAVEVSLDLRFRGQDFEIAVPLAAGDGEAARAALRAAFLDAYRGLYGYVSADAVEVVAIRLLARGPAPAAIGAGAAPAAAAGERRRPVWFDGADGWTDTPVVERGAVLAERAGPLVVESADTTIVVPPGARIAPGPAGTLVATLADEAAAGTADDDPITFAVIKSGLDTIVDEMAYTVMRTARSTIVRDVLDYSVTLCDAAGRILSQAKTVALHLGAVPDAMDEILARFEGRLAPGDVVVLNDPYAGGMHLPDIFMVKPIFRGGRRLGFSVVIAHHSDVGGRVPGSNASDSTEIYQEGLRIPPMKLFEAGRRNETLIQLITANVRLPDLVLGDLDAQAATCAIGERELLRLAERYGEAALAHHFDRLIDYGEALTRKAISAWPDGDYAFTDFIDGDGFSPDPIPISCRIRVAGDRLEVDFAGSSPQVKGAINATLSFVKSATYLTIRCALDREVPNNAGVYRCIAVTAPEGSILNPRLPAPVAARALTGYRVVDTVMGALAQIVPERVMAAGEGGNTVVALGGRDRASGEPFILVDMINGAWGGRFGKDGIEGVTNPSQNMSNLPIETLEARYPIRMEAYGLRPDSGGAGATRGGLGLVRSYRLLAEEAVLQLRADRTEHPPYGLFGGLPGATSRNFIDEGGGLAPLPGKVTREVRRGTLVLHEQAGGGGYGDPLDRPTARIAADLADGKVTPAAAARDHGVVFAGGAIDEAATAARRAALRAQQGDVR